MRLIYLLTILKILHVSTQPYLLAPTKHPLTHHLHQNHCHYTLSKLIELSLYLKQISRVKNNLDAPSSLLACMKVSDYKASFAPMHLVFLEIDKNHCYLDFKLFDENNNAVIPKTFYLQLLNKLFRGIFAWWNWSSWTACKKDDIIEHIQKQ